MNNWGKSENIGALAAALCEVQSQMKPAAKDAVNPHFKSKYADLGSLWETCRELLGTHGLSIVQLPGGGEGVISLTTVLMHTSGEWISSDAQTVPRAFDPQAVGSAITYLRRYSLAAMLGVVADEDDDGNAGSRPAQSGKPAQVQNIQDRKPAASKPAAKPEAKQADDPEYQKYAATLWKHLGDLSVAGQLTREDAEAVRPFMREAYRLKFDVERAGKFAVGASAIAEDRKNNMTTITTNWQAATQTMRDAVAA